MRVLSLLLLLLCGPVLSQVTQPVTPESVGRVIYPRSAGEISAAVLPSYYRYPVGNVRRNGALCNGVSDDTTAIQQALNSSLYVWIEDGLTCLVSSQLTPRSGTTFEMRGNATLKGTVKDWLADGLVGLLSVTDVTLRGGIYDGDKSSNTNGQQFGIEMRDVSRVRVEGARFKNFPANAALGSGGDGIYIGRTSTGCNDVVISNSTFDGNVRQGISVVAGVGVRIVGNSFTGTSGNNPGGGIDLEANSVSDPLRNITITGNYFEDNFYGVIAQQYSSNVTISSNTFKASRRTDIYLAGTSNVTVSGNVVQAGSSSATGIMMELLAVSGGTITGNTFLGVGGASSTEGAAVRLTVAVDNVSIVGNYIANARLQGLVIGGSAMATAVTNVLVSGNTFVDNVDPVVGGAGTGVIAITGNSTGGIYPSKITVANNNIVDSRSGGNEADVGITVSSNIPLANQSTYRVANNRIAGPALDITNATARPMCIRVTYDAPSLAANEAATNTGLTLTGALVGDLIDVFPNINLSGTQATGYVTAADTTAMMIENPTTAAGTVNLANAVYTLCVRRPNSL